VPQSQLVAAQSHTPADNVSGLDFTKVTGMFLDGNHLYYVYASTGVLARIDWDGSAPVAGTRVKVSGPTIDGINWASAGLFLYPGPSAPAAMQARAKQATTKQATTVPPPSPEATPTSQPGR